MQELIDLLIAYCAINILTFAILHWLGYFTFAPVVCLVTFNQLMLVSALHSFIKCNNLYRDI